MRAKMCTVGRMSGPGYTAWAAGELFPEASMKCIVFPIGKAKARKQGEIEKAMRTLQMPVEKKVKRAQHETYLLEDTNLNLE